jgi:hypothetical protein
MGYTPKDLAKTVVNLTKVVVVQQPQQQQEREQKLQQQLPPRSPDCTPCDSYLFGRMKDLVYAPPLSTTIYELKGRIQQVWVDLPADEIRSALSIT